MIREGVISQGKGLRGPYVSRKKEVKRDILGLLNLPLKLLYAKKDIFLVWSRSSLQWPVHSRRSIEKNYLPHSCTFAISTLECFSSWLDSYCQPIQWTYWGVSPIPCPQNWASIGFHGKYAQTHKTKSTWGRDEGVEAKETADLVFFSLVKSKIDLFELWPVGTCKRLLFELKFCSANLML